VFRNFYEFTSQLLFPIFQIRRSVISESTGYKIHCLIFKVHPRSFRSFAPFFLALEYYTTNFPVCQPLFEKNFFGFSLQKIAQTVDIIRFFRPLNRIGIKLFVYSIQIKNIFSIFGCLF